MHSQEEGFYKLQKSWTSGWKMPNRSGLHDEVRGEIWAGYASTEALTSIFCHWEDKNLISGKNAYFIVKWVVVDDKGVTLTTNQIQSTLNDQVIVCNFFLMTNSCLWRLHGVCF